MPKTFIDDRLDGRIRVVTDEDASLTALLVAGLTAVVTKEERAAARMPPYPMPAAQRLPRHRRLVELVSWLPADGDGPPTVTRIQGKPGSYRSAVDSLRRPGLFDFGDAACALLAVGALTDADVEELAGFLPRYCGVRRQQVLNRLTVDDLAGARAAAERIPDGLSWVGYRDIGGVLADRGDTEGFFSDWKRYAPGRDALCPRNHGTDVQPAERRSPAGIDGPGQARPSRQGGFGRRRFLSTEDTMRPSLCDYMVQYCGMVRYYGDGRELCGEVRYGRFAAIPRQ